MHNLKRTFTLALSGLMMTSLLAISAGAKGLDDFSDSDKIINRDAVAVTSEIGIFKGYDDGTFGGDRVVTRAEMAVIISKILHGADVSVAQFAESNVFTDVPDWAAGYINLCASLGIVSGVGDNKFDPSSTVTTAQAALMLSKALGYFKNDAEYGSDWMLAATTKATELGLFGDLSLSASAGLTRDDVAEMTFNALTEAVPVQYNESFNTYYNVQNGLIYGLQFNYLETLGYTNFNLVYSNSEQADSFSRPGIIWGTGSVRSGDSTDSSGNLIPSYVVVRDEIIAMTAEPDFVFTGATEQREVVQALGADLAGSKWSVFMNGKKLSASEFSLPSKTSNETFGLTGNGLTTELYVVGTDVTAIVYGSYAVEVTRVNKDNDKTVVTVSNPVTAAGATVMLNDRTFATDAFEVGDIALITISCNDQGRFFINSISKPDTAVGALTATSSTLNNIYVNDEKYFVSDFYNNGIFINLKTGTELNKNYVFYLDGNGNVVSMDELDKIETSYVFVTSVDTYLSQVDAIATFSDGTEKQIAVNPDKSTIPTSRTEDFIASYVEADGKYTLTAVQTDAYKTVTIEANARTITAGKETLRVDDTTVFVDVAAKKTYTGYAEVPTYVDADIVVGRETGNRLADVIFIVSGEAQLAEKTYFVLGDTDSITRMEDGVSYDVFSDAYVDGKKVTANGGLWVRSEAVDRYQDANNAKLSTFTMYAVEAVDTTDRASRIGAVSNKELKVTNVASRTIWAGDTPYTHDATTTFVLIDDQDELITTGTYRDIVLESDDKDYFTRVYALEVDDDDHLELVYLRTVSLDKK